jgi:APA family basic amino acid/polyamine antiporter
MVAMDRNKIGTVAATAVGLGAIIGAGIFTLSGTAIALAGAWSLFSFILVGFVAIVIALEIGELCSIFPNANGASYSYVFEAFGSELGFITGVLLYFSYASAISVVALGFGAYLTTLLGISPDAYGTLLAIIIIAVLSAVNLQGIKKAARADLGLVVKGRNTDSVHCLRSDFHNEESHFLQHLVSGTARWRIHGDIQCERSHILRLLRLPDNSHLCF